MVQDSRKLATLLGIDQTKATEEDKKHQAHEQPGLTERQVRAKLPTFNRDIFQFGRLESGKARAQQKTSRRINRK